MTDHTALADVHRLICDVWSMAGPHAEMHVGDLYWALFHSAKIDRRAATRLWYDNAGMLLAAAVYPGATWCDVIVRPNSPAEVFEELIDWAESGLIEPVGCHPDFRRRGLSRFLLLEGLRRLHQRGATQAVVRVHHTNTAALALYESCGFRVVTSHFGYERHLA